MKRTIALILTFLLLTLSLSACGEDPPVTNPSGPGRMVRRIEVAIHPQDPAFDRTYVTQENMNELLSLLRSLHTDVEPEQEPDPNDGQNLYTATITFANGQQSVYYLLGRTSLRLGDEPWCVIAPEQAVRFTDFIRAHPSDDGSAPTETAAPTQTTAPAQ